MVLTSPCSTLSPTHHPPTTPPPTHLDPTQVNVVEYKALGFLPGRVTQEGEIKAVSNDTFEVRPLAECWRLWERWCLYMCLCWLLLTSVLRHAAPAVSSTLACSPSHPPLPTRPPALPATADVCQRRAARPGDPPDPDRLPGRPRAVSLLSSAAFCLCGPRLLWGTRSGVSLRLRHRPVRCAARAAPCLRLAPTPPCPAPLLPPAPASVARSIPGDDAEGAIFVFKRLGVEEKEEEEEEEVRRRRRRRC